MPKLPVLADPGAALTGNLAHPHSSHFQNLFEPHALPGHGGNYRHGDLAQCGEYVAAGATNARRLATGEIALARGWLQSETKRLVFHHRVCPRIRLGTASSKALGG